jgi:hypothetical protein
VILTPLQKFAAYAFAAAINVTQWIWVASQVDALALGLNVHLYNIIAIAIAGCVTLATLILGYMGLKAPTLEDRGETHAP